MTDALMDSRMNNPNAISPFNFFEVGGHEKSSEKTAYTWMILSKNQGTGCRFLLPMFSFIASINAP